jgi:hypothetical protein
VVTVIRVARVVLLLALVLLTISFVIGIGRPGTSAVEKVVLVALIVGCVVIAAKLSTIALALQKWLQRN